MGHDLRMRMQALKFKGLKSKFIKIVINRIFRSIMSLKFQWEIQFFPNSSNAIL